MPMIAETRLLVTGCLNIRLRLRYEKIFFSNRVHGLLFKNYSGDFVHKGREGGTVHNVYFVKYNVTVSFLAQVLDTVTYFVSQVLVVDTVTYW